MFHAMFHVSLVYRIKVFYSALLVQKLENCIAVVKLLISHNTCFAGLTCINNLTYIHVCMYLNCKYLLWNFADTHYSWLLPHSQLYIYKNVFLDKCYEELLVIFACVHILEYFPQKCCYSILFWCKLLNMLIFMHWWCSVKTYFEIFLKCCICISVEQMASVYLLHVHAVT